jgi:hypothetical protein
VYVSKFPAFGQGHGQGIYLPGGHAGSVAAIRWFYQDSGFVSVGADDCVVIQYKCVANHINTSPITGNGLVTARLLPESQTGDLYACIHTLQTVHQEVDRSYEWSAMIANPSVQLYTQHGDVLSKVQPVTKVSTIQFIQYVLDNAVLCVV